MKKLIDIFMMPILAIRLRYIPLLTIYFAYGSSVFVNIASTFWVKEKLLLSAEDLLALSVWLVVPWSIKMVFGQLVDSVKIFNSNRKVYVYIGALFIFVATCIFVAMVGEYEIVASYKKESLFVFASVLNTIGFVMQDVVADTMSTEVIDESKSKKEQQKELAIIQVLGRLSLGIAIFIMGWLGGKVADIYGYEVVFYCSFFIPFLSIIGVVFVRLNEQEPTILNKRIFFGGLVFAVFVILMGYSDIPYAQEIVFIVSFSVVVYFLDTLICDLDKNTIRHIKMAMIVIFVYRAMPSVGPALNWWEIDVLGFDKEFFALLSLIGGGISLIGIWFFAKLVVNTQISKILIYLVIISTILSIPIIGLYYNVHHLLNISAKSIMIADVALLSPFDYISMVAMLTLVAIYAPKGKKGTWFALMASFMNLAISASGLLSKYLNKIFVVTREIKEKGVVVVPQDYSQLGVLISVVVAIGFFVPIATIMIFKIDKNNT